MNRLRSLLTLLLVLCCTAGFAQGGPGQSAIGETMRSNGRIYVVIAVILVILAGLILYLVRLDKKMSRLEKGQ